MLNTIVSRISGIAQRIQLTASMSRRLRVTSVSRVIYIYTTVDAFLD